MLFNQHHTLWFLLALLPMVVAGCATATPENAYETQPAVIAESGFCHGAIEAAMKSMTGSNSIRLSPDAFRTEPMVLLSNYIPAELLPGASHQFSEAADRRFFLHLQKGRCLLSLVEEGHYLIATEHLYACECAPMP